MIDIKETHRIKERKIKYERSGVCLKYASVMQNVMTCANVMGQVVMGNVVGFPILTICGTDYLCVSGLQHAIWR